jgi:hypothetical protein
MFHVTGTYWTLVSDIGGMSEATRVGFRIAPDGSVSELGVEFDAAMRVKGEKIWWRRV